MGNQEATREPTNSGQPLWRLDGAVVSGELDALTGGESDSSEGEIHRAAAALVRASEKDYGELFAFVIHYVIFCESPISN